MVILGSVLTAGVAAAQAQEDPLEGLAKRIHEATHNRVKITFEERTRWEEKDGVNFGKSVNQQDMLSRIRVGAQFQLLDWLTISAMGQDARAPFYGTGAPNTVRDPMSLWEDYVQLFRNRDTGFGALFGREMLSYGEGRLIASPQWSNLSRTFDTASVYYRLRHARLEAVMVSPVKIVPGTYNAPELGERIWGTYSTFGSVWKSASFDAYALRHSQNKIGGWTGAGTLGTDTYGGRLYGPLPYQLAYSFEGAAQAGHQGLETQRAYAWYSSVSKQATLGRMPLSAMVEYKFASGNQYGSSTDGTFDQLSPANHDKFGHEDLFGWRNLRTLRSLETLSLTKKVALNVMYADEFLASRTDGLYNSTGSVISISTKGTASNRVGQELDSFVTYRIGAHLLGVGGGHFFKGEFVDLTTHNINPRYFYVFQQYSFR
jgi:hypothetical protein